MTAEQLKAEALDIYKGFEKISKEGVVCSIPETGVNAQLGRFWCAPCKHLFQRLKKLGEP